MNLLSEIWPYIAAVIPTAGVAFLFYVVIKNMLEGDRRERIAHAQWEREQDRLDEQRRAAAPAEREQTEKTE